MTPSCCGFEEPQPLPFFKNLSTESPGRNRRLPDKSHLALDECAFFDDCDFRATPVVSNGGNG
jgi:hypothetical protein